MQYLPHFGAWFKNGKEHVWEGYMQALEKWSTLKTNFKTPVNIDVRIYKSK